MILGQKIIFVCVRTILTPNIYKRINIPYKKGYYNGVRSGINVVRVVPRSSTILRSGLAAEEHVIDEKAVDF
jgi:hypothetical protein